MAVWSKVGARAWAGIRGGRKLQEPRPRRPTPRRARRRAPVETEHHPRRGRAAGPVRGGAPPRWAGWSPCSDRSTPAGFRRPGGARCQRWWLVALLAFGFLVLALVAVAVARRLRRFGTWTSCRTSTP